MKKVLVQSVGTGQPGEDITRELFWSVRAISPMFVLWIVSSETRPHAERLVGKLDLRPDQWSIHELTVIDNVEEVYRQCLGAIRDLKARGTAPEEIEVDFTRGTKAMTAGLTLAAVACRCQFLTYVTGPRHASGGQVIEGTERQERIEPRRIWADERLRLAGDYCRAMRFDAALSLLDTVNPAWLGDYERRLADGFRAVAIGYGAWDRFDYARATGELTKLGEIAVADLQEFQVDRAVLSRLLGLKPETGLTADRLADLFNNAGRRLDEGRYDDALARLYRSAEMLAQWILRKDFAIDTADVDAAKVPVDLRETLEASRNAAGVIQIGLDWDYRLLNAKGHEVGRRFDHGEFAGIGVLLKQRNTSLLAHGLAPITKKDVESLQEKLVGLISLEAPDFAERRAAFEFPWRRSRG
jgi:CRISPR-associated protein (TIGR02710 family)